jgi:hypothetical protein
MSSRRRGNLMALRREDIDLTGGTATLARSLHTVQ